MKVFCAAPDAIALPREVWLVDGWMSKQPAPSFASQRHALSRNSSPDNTDPVRKQGSWPVSATERIRRAQIWVRRLVPEQRPIALGYASDVLKQAVRTVLAGAVVVVERTVHSSDREFAGLGDTVAHVLGQSATSAAMRYTLTYCSTVRASGSRTSLPRLPRTALLPREMLPGDTCRLRQLPASLRSIRAATHRLP